MINLFKIKRFKVTENVGNFIYMDGINRRFKIPRKNLLEKLTKSQIYEFEDLIDVKLIYEEGIIVGTQSILPRILFGSLGQFIANRKASYCCTILEVKVIMEETNRYIEIINKPVKRGSKAYKKARENAEEVIKTLEFIKKCNTKINFFNVCIIVSS